MAENDRIKEITANLEQGILDLFESEKYAAYLQTMSRFHNYSSRNIMLIHMQYPAATRVASFLSWKNNFNRHVKKGEHGIKIFAPIASKKKDEDIEVEKLDPVTKQAVLDENGQPVTERLTPLSSLQSMRFKVVSVFDASQTEGDPLPELAETLNGSVERYDLFMDALRAVSPLPIVFEPMDGDQDGYCDFGNKIGIREGMSEVQTVCAAVHEITHAKLHDRNSLAENAVPKNHRVMECEAESCSYSTLSYFGIDTGANSFGYLLEWAKSRELKEFKASLDTIRKATAELISGIEENYRALAKERDTPTPPSRLGGDLGDLSVVTDELGAEANYNMIDGVINNTPPTDAEQQTATEPPTVTEQPQPEEPPAQAEPQPTAALAILAEYERHAAVRDPRRVGANILMTLLFEDGNLNRAGKRSIVKVEPPIGKYEIFSRDEGTPPHQTNCLYAMTASGRPALLGETDRLKDLTEARLDEHIRLLAESFEKQLANPAEWADFAAAAFLNRVDEAEAHNIPVRELREAESQARRDAAREREKQAAAEKQEIFDARVDEIAKAIERGEGVKVGYDARENGGKNPVLELFRLYGVDLPPGTQGWVNTTLAAITPEGYSRYTKIGGKKRGESERFGERLVKLKQAVKRMPIEQKRGIADDKPAPDTEVKRTLEHDLYEKFAEMFPDFMDRKYSSMRLTAEHAKPLELEWVFGDTLSIAHTYEINGKPAYEPLVMLKADSANKTLTASSLELSEPPRNDVVCGVDGEVDTGMRENINNFTSQWLDRAEKQGFMPVSATLWNEGGIDDVDSIVMFDKDGNVAAAADIAEAGGEIQEILDAFAAKHGFGKLTAEFYSDAFTKKEPQSVIIREGAERHELLRRNLFEFSKGERMSAAHLSAYFSRLETMKAYVAKGHDDMTLYDIDVIKARRDYKVRERQTKMGKDTDLPLPAAKNCGIGDMVLIYDPNKTKCSYMKVEGLNKKNVVLSDIANGFVKVKLSAERFKKEQGYNLIESPEVNKPPQPETPKQTALDLSLPDPTVTAAAMNEYGYTEPDMYPLSAERALELFDAGHTIYLLYDDNTEAVAFESDDIITFSSGGLCGITKTDWEMSPVRNAQNEVYEDAISNRKQTEASLEADLLYGDNPYYRENKYGIYQIKDDIDEARGFRSAPMKELEAHGLTVNRDNYSLVYTADLPYRIEFLRDKTTALNSLFEKFNTDHPADYTGRSMSVSDVVVLRCNGDITAHFVDSAGFVELPSFTGDERETPAGQAFSQVGKSPTVSEADIESGKSGSLLELANAANAERKSGARNITGGIPRDERPQKATQKGKPSILAELDELRKIAGSGGRQNNYKKSERGYE
jgi:Skp family chaperone for outer membrane proteins